MAIINLVKSIYTNNDVTALGELQAGDVIQLPATITSVNNTTQTTIFSYNVVDYRTADLVCQIVDTTNNHYHSVKFFVIHNGVDVWYNQTDVIHTHNELGTFTFTISSGTVQLSFTAVAATNKTIKVAAIAVTP